jgi:hypothetical protein
MTCPLMRHGASNPDKEGVVGGPRAQVPAFHPPGIINCTSPVEPRPGSELTNPAWWLVRSEWKGNEGKAYRGSQ